MTHKYLAFSIAITFISFIVGMISNGILKKTEFYNNELSNLNFIKSEKLNKWIGIGVIKWIVKNTPFKYFNQKIKLKTKIERTDLYILRKDMANSEIDHLIGFAFVTIFAFVKFYKTEILFGLTIMIVNALMNLYPSLLQQQNKRRIDKLIKTVANIGLAIWRLKCFYETFVQGSTVRILLNFSASTSATSPSYKPLAITNFSKQQRHPNQVALLLSENH